MTTPAAKRNPVPIAVAVVVGLLAILVVRKVTTGSPTAATGSGGTAGPSAPTVSADCRIQLAVTASSEKAALLSQVAGDYLAANRTVAGQRACFSVTAKASGGAEQALARGWDAAADGPRPDVWSPAGSVWVTLLQHDLTVADKPALAAATNPSVAQTPLVLAMPQPMAEALGWPGADLGWADVLSLGKGGWAAKGHPEWGAFTLGKTNPTLSTSGLNATIGAYVAATGTSGDLTEADLAKPAVADYVKSVESSVVHYGDTTLTFLSNLQRADDKGQGLEYVSAVAVEEKSVWDYDQGNPSGDPKTLGQHAKPRVPLVAIYPQEGTLLSDSPWTVLTADWVGQDKKAVAADVLAFLKEPTQQARFTAAAFRGADGSVDRSRVSQANGLLPDKAFTVLASPSPTVLAGVEAGWAQLRKRARVLVVLDTSGSMDSAAGDGTRLSLARKGAQAALRQFADDDVVGLWGFALDPDDPGTDHTELVPFGPVGAERTRLDGALAGLRASGGTPLYRVTRSAVAAVAAGYDATRINAVVLLTDGRNEDPTSSLAIDALVQQLSGADEPVRVFTIGYAQDASQTDLTAISNATAAASYDASDPTSIDKVFTNVVSNF